MSGTTGAELFVETLEHYGVEHVFGNPGTTELPVMQAIADSDLAYVLGLHEDVAVGLAAGYAQTRRYHSHHDPSIRPVGVVNLHTLPGTAHGLGNLYNADVTGAPLVVTAGVHSTDFQVREPILSGDLAALTDQFCKWTAEVPDAETLPLHLRRAFRVAMTPPTGPVFLALPLDVMLSETEATPERLGPIPSGGAGAPAELDRATDCLLGADAPVLVVGDQVARADAVEEAVAFAEAAGARVHGEILACEVDFPTDHEHWVSYIPPDEDLARTLLSTDTLVLAGCSTNTTLVRHEGELIDRGTDTVQVGVDPWELGKNEPADATVRGDPGAILGALADRVDDRLDPEERETRLEDVAAFKAMAEKQMRALGEDAAEDPRASKADLVDALEAAAPEAFIVDEGVTAKYAMLTRWSLSPEQYISNKGGGLGYGLPAAVGAAMAERTRTDREPRDVIGFVGDGSYLYYPHTLYTAARYGVDLTVVIPDNRNYRILKDNTLDLFGGAEADYDFVGMDFEPPVDIPANAESHGATGRLIEDAPAIESAVTDAVATDGPVVLDVLVHD
ncbi:MAG: thiamine pyrophosphate-binding protein [Halobacteriales archaeon]